MFKNSAEIIRSITFTGGNVAYKWLLGDRLPSATTQSGPKRLRFPGIMLDRPMHAYMESLDHSHWARQAYDKSQQVHVGGRHG